MKTDVLRNAISKDKRRCLELSFFYNWHANNNNGRKRKLMSLNLTRVNADYNLPRIIFSTLKLTTFYITTTSLFRPNANRMQPILAFVRMPRTTTSNWN